MFRAMRKDTNEWISALDMDLQYLRNLGKQNNIICPDCGALMNVRAGTKTPHFYHQKGSNCTNIFGEPETVEHLNGKLSIFNFLKEHFPSQKVELEYRVEETNQRSDVMLILTSGEKVAFEFQCSAISHDVILERRYLYEKAGINDIWIFGDSVHKYGVSDKKTDRHKHRVKGMERAIYDQDKRLLYFDPKINQIRIIEDAFDYGTQLRGSDVIFGLDVMKFKDGTFMSPKDEEREVERIRREEERKRNREERLNNYSKVVAFRIIDLYRKNIHYSRRHLIAIIKEYKDGLPVSISLVRDPLDFEDRRLILETENPDSNISKIKVEEKYRIYINSLELKYHVDSPMKWTKINGLKSYNDDLYEIVLEPLNHYDNEYRFEWFWREDRWVFLKRHKELSWDIKRNILNTFKKLVNEEL